MIDRPLEQVGPSDFELLVIRRKAEGRTLDFKRDLYEKTDAGTRDFLADVTAFANTDGGDIVIGVSDDGDGQAAEVVGIAAEGIDERVLGFEHQLKDCVDPRLSTVRFRQVDLGTGRCAIVIRVGASDSAPHRVTYRGSSRFHARHSRGNYDLSTGELRRAFAASDEMPRKIRDLHRQAVSATGGIDMPCRLADGPRAVLTVAPKSVLRESRDLRFTRELAVLPPRIEGDRLDMSVGLDGLVVHAGLDSETGCVRSWSINNRRGFVDFAWTIGRTEGDQKRVWRKYVDGEIVGASRSALARLMTFGVEGPWVAMATLSRIGGYRLVSGDGLTPAAWQDTAYLGEVVADTLDADTLKPILDGFWRSFGIEDGPAIGS